MRFEIDFNTERDNNHVLEQMAQLHHETDYSYYFVEINSLEELKELQLRVNALMGIEPYSFAFAITFFKWLSFSYQ